MTVPPGGSYARSIMIRLIGLIVAVLLTTVCSGQSRAIADSDDNAKGLLAEDYVLYDQVVTSKFLTSATRLVVIERMTRLRLFPDQEGPTTIEAFQDEQYFDGELPSDLIENFISVNRQASRLEGRFDFPVGYRFATGDAIEEPEVSLAHPVTVAQARLAQAPSVLSRLAFSRVARNLRNDQALLYVEILRPDETGAGFLVWCRRQGPRWILFDTDVVWTIHDQGAPDEEPLLAP